jgi:hypothetical protein
MATQSANPAIASRLRRMIGELALVPTDAIIRIEERVTDDEIETIISVHTRRTDTQRWHFFGAAAAIGKADLASAFADNPLKR